MWGRAVREFDRWQPRPEAFRVDLYEREVALPRDAHHFALELTRESRALDAHTDT